MQIEFLEAVVTQIADHEQRAQDSDQHGGRHHEARFARRDGIAEPHQGGDQRGRRRAWQPLKITLVGDPDLSVEACEPERGAGGIHERHHEAEFAQAAQRPLIHHERWRHAERHHIRQAVVLRTEIALGIGHARDATIHTVEHHRHQDRDRGGLKAAIDGGDHPIETGKQRAGGEQIGQQVDAGATSIGRQG